MLKYILVISACIFLATGANSQNRDTSVYYFRNAKPHPILVSTLDSADYFRVVLPAEAGNTIPLKEFYKNGKIKFIGQLKYKQLLSADNPEMFLDGDCITYYESGKKQSFTKYKDGFTDGDQYLFYPNGKVYCYVKNVREYFGKVTTLFRECYDADGNMICSDGNGKWFFYDEAYTTVTSQGAVKNGCLDGEWHGKSMSPDTIKYISLYKGGRLIKNTAYGKDGTPYQFEQVYRQAAYRGAAPAFIQSVRNYLKWPKGEDIKQNTIDTMHISFIIEKDGRITEPEVLGTVKQDIKDALITAMMQSNGWVPGKYYGIPFRTQLTLPLKYADVDITKERFRNITDQRLLQSRFTEETSVFYLERRLIDP